MFLFFIKKLRGLFNTYLVYKFNINKNHFLNMVIMGTSYVVGFPLMKPSLSNGRTNSAVSKAKPVPFIRGAFLWRCRV